MNRRAPACCRETLWHTAATVHKFSLPDKLRRWLLDDGSLTRRLRTICSENFRVKILHQGRAAPMVNEAQRLGIPAQQWVFCREVLLYCDNRAMVYARTVIPAAALKGRLRRLANLGEKPLGEILFADPHIKRGGLEIAQLQLGELLYEKLLQAKPCNQPLGEKAIWARRSAFLYHDKRLLVSEIFLPNSEFGYGQ